MRNVDRQLKHSYYRLYYHEFKKKKSNIMTPLWEFSIQDNITEEKWTLDLLW